MCHSSFVLQINGHSNTLQKKCFPAGALGRSGECGVVKARVEGIVNLIKIIL
jgi:hypothetical protein